MGYSTSATGTPSGVPQPLAKLAAMVRGGSNAHAINAIWAPAVAAILILLVGAIGSRLKQPWLFAGLGPTIFMIAFNPGQETSRFRAVVGGHLAALGCAYAALFLLSATAVAPLLATLKLVAPMRVWASVFALALLAFVQPQLRAYHPPAAATALLLTLGFYRLQGKPAMAFMGGVVIVALAAELLQRVRPGRH
jgi:hypothetical protein